MTKYRALCIVVWSLEGSDRSDNDIMEVPSTLPTVVCTSWQRNTVVMLIILIKRINTTVRIMR